jgi:hypothetical protein
VVADVYAPNGERYESVSREDMASACLAGTAGGEYLNHAVEDRQKTYDGPTPWMPSAGVLAAAAVEAPAMTNFRRHFADLRIVPINAGHFFCEEQPADTAAALLAFLEES